MSGPGGPAGHRAAAQAGAGGRRALVVTVSDGVAAGTREDRSGAVLATRLEELGFVVDRALVPDEIGAIEQLLFTASERHVLILTTGGTGLGPRDVTPQATRAVLDIEVPGIPELMRSEGRRSTLNAYLSRSVAGVRRGCLIVNLPGSPAGAIDSFAAIETLLDHALATMAGPLDHGVAGRTADAATVRPRGGSETRGGPEVRKGPGSRSGHA